jgi:integrase/recombinase XerD
MEINIVPVEWEALPRKTKAIQVEVQTAPATKVSIEQIFAEFLEMEVGDGAASADTIKSYLSQSKMYFTWCKDNLVPILEADRDDIKL